MQTKMWSSASEVLAKDKKHVVAARQGWCGRLKKMCQDKEVMCDLTDGSCEEMVERKKEILMEDQVGKIKPDLEFWGADTLTSGP